MLTEKACLEAINDIDYDLCELESYRAGFDVHVVFSEALEIFKQLVKEHFDNPTSKLEELKEGMFVWDNKEKEWIKIVNIVRFLGTTTYIYFYKTGYSELIDSEYEESRYFRNEPHK